MTAILLNNRYQILETLARGGFGETFLAIDTHLPSSRKCVIKKLKPAVPSTHILEWLKDRFGREAAILEDLGENNPQIPQLYAYFADNSDFYLVQEWIEGVTLTQKHQQQGNLSEGEVTKILIDLLPVLDFIHTRRIIHRDIKPDNIILRHSDGLPVLIDFGVVKEAVATVVNPHGQTAYSVALGTPGYMASEQAAGRPVYSSDLYSLGLTAIFLLSGKTPQYLETDSHTGEILWRNAVGDIHSNLAMVIDKALRFHPRDRFSSAKEMLAALKTLIQHQTTATVVVSPKGRSKQPLTPKPSPQTLPEAEVEKRFSIWRWLLSILLLGGVATGAFVVGFLLFLPKQQTRPTSSPQKTVIPSVIQPSPSVESPPSPIRRRPKPRYTPIPEAAPIPEVTPTPEATPTPEPDISPSPDAEVTPTPIPQDTPTTEPEVTPTPEPEVTPVPDTPSPVDPNVAPPEDTTQPSPDRTEPSITTTPSELP